MHTLFKELFQQYYESLVTYAYRYVNDWQIAEDIVQDVFMGLWLKRSSVNFNDPIKPYFYKATYNKAMNHLTSLYNNSKTSIESTDELINRIIIECNQYDTLLAKETSAEIQLAIESLPPQCKNIFHLSRERYLKNKEIALLLNISEKAVEKQITKALSIIREQLRDLDLLPMWLILFFLK